MQCLIMRPRRRRCNGDRGLPDCRGGLEEDSDLRPASKAGRDWTGRIATVEIPQTAIGLRRSHAQVAYLQLAFLMRTYKCTSTRTHVRAQVSTMTYFSYSYGYSIRNASWKKKPIYCRWLTNVLANFGNFVVKILTMSFDWILCVRQALFFAKTPQSRQELVW